VTGATLRIETPVLISPGTACGLQAQTSYTSWAQERQFNFEQFPPPLDRALVSNTVFRVARSLNWLRMRIQLYFQ
jgi:hypothetical protein